MEPIRVFVGFDAREAIGTYTFLQSVRDHTRARVQFEFLYGDLRDSTNAFGPHIRFTVPARCDFRGWALFFDGADMLARTSLEELMDLRDGYSAVQVVKHDYATRHPRKYVGTDMESANEDYPRKNWSSVMLFWNDHSACRKLTLDYVTKQSAQHLHRFEWAEDERVGELPREWNWLADEYGENPDAKLVHWTAGIPGFRAYRDAPHADEWRSTMTRAMRGLQTHRIEEVA